MTAAGVLERLVRGLPVLEHVVVVTAHPDDETVSLGGALGLLAHVTIVQLTDGAIDDPDAWTKAGVTSRADYRCVRSVEQAAACLALGTPARIVECHVIDQQTVGRLGALIDVVTPHLVDADLVFTHPYEGGHVDHDSAAFIVQQACARLTQPPARVEFASYHWDGQTRRAGVFWPVAGHPAVTALISDDRVARKQAAIAAYASQASVTRWFPVSREAYRIAPVYDFSQPPTTPACWYDRKAWKTTSAQWRAAAAAVLARQAVSA